MAIMRTNRLASKTTTPPRRVVPASELEAQDAAFKSANQNYEAQMNTYKNADKSAKSYSQFKGGPVDVSKAGLAQYNRSRSSDMPEVTRIERPRASGSEADFLSRVNSKGGFIGHVTYKEPTKPTEKKADWSTVQLDKMPTKKAVVTPSAKLRTNPAQAEKADFNYPSRNVSKMGTKAAKTGGGKSGLVRAKGQGDLGAARAGVIKTKSPAGYNREKSQFEAFAAAGGDQTKAMFKNEMKQSKQVGARYRAEGNAEGTEMMRQEAKQYKKAAQFAGKLAKGNNKFFERDMVSSFRDSKQNAANRNTIEAKITAAGKSANRNTLY
jgi:hypothetical protein